VQALQRDQWAFQPVAFPEALPSADSARWRIALYSHDTMGLGHVRRNLLLAQALSHCVPPSDILMIVGRREGNGFLLPPNVDCITLPGLHKNTEGSYSAAHWGLGLKELIALRAQTMLASIKAFQPDVLIVDNVPRGAMGELDPTLQWTYDHGHTRCVLGLRDILDDPATVRREWRRTGNERIIEQFYDQVWVYGDPCVYDPVREYGLSPAVAAKVQYLGYLDQRSRIEAHDPAGIVPVLPPLPPGPFVLCTVGGGQDGADLALAFSQAPLPSGTYGVLLMGPFMPAEMQQRIRHHAAHNPRMQVWGHISEPASLLCQAERVICMGGYNTVTEVLSHEKHALIVPRVKPRREQLIRAQRLHDLGLVDMLHPEELAPLVLHDWMSRDLGEPPRVHEQIDMRALDQIPVFTAQLLVAVAQEQQHKGAKRVA